MHRMSARLICFVGVACFALGCGDPCALGDVQARLDAAGEGGVVDVGSCTLTGPLRVPAGVTLRGVGARLVGSSDASAVVLETSAGLTTRLEDLTIEAHHVGVEARGEGEALVSSVTVELETGVGVLTTAAASTLRDVVVRGTVEETNRDDGRWLSITSATAPTHGIVIAAGTAMLERVTAEGTAWATLSIGETLAAEGRAPIDVTLVGSSVRRSLGVGISSSAQQLSLVDSRIDQIWSGVRGWPSYAVLLVDGEATTMNSIISNADGYGLVEIAGRSSHADLVVEHTGDVGVWLGTGVECAMMGSATRIADTGFAGVLAIDSTSLTLAGARIDGVRALRRTVGVSGSIEVGDGIDAFGTSLTLTDVAVTGAARAGLLLDGAMLAPSDLTRVTVTSEGAGLGAVLGDVDRTGETFAHDPTPPAGWDVGITRVGAAITNDAAFTGSLSIAVAPSPPSATDALGVVAPMY